MLAQVEVPTKAPSTAVVMVRCAIMYNDGAPMHEIAETIGIPISYVQDLINTYNLIFLK
jgi:transposase-like protein